MRIALALLAVPLVGQIDSRIVCDPEPHSSDLPGIKDTLLYDCSVTNYSAQQVIVSPGMLMAAVPSLHPIAPARASEIVKNTNASSGKSKALVYIKYVLYIALGVTGGGFVTASKLVIAGIGLGVGLAGDIKSDITAAQPNLADYAENIPTTGLTLAPFQQTGFFTAFTLRASGPATTVQGQIYFPPVAAVPAKPTSYDGPTHPASTIVVGWEVPMPDAWQLASVR